MTVLHSKTREEWVAAFREWSGGLDPIEADLDSVVAFCDEHSGDDQDLLADVFEMLLPSDVWFDRTKLDVVRRLLNKERG